MKTPNVGRCGGWWIVLKNFWGFVCCRAWLCRTAASNCSNNSCHLLELRQSHVTEFGNWQIFSQYNIFRLYVSMQYEWTPWMQVGHCCTNLISCEYPFINKEINVRFIKRSWSLFGLFKYSDTNWSSLPSMLKPMIKTVFGSLIVAFMFSSLCSKYFAFFILLTLSTLADLNVQVKCHTLH